MNKTCISHQLISLIIICTYNIVPSRICNYIFPINRRHRNAKEQQKRADRISFEAKRMCESVAGIVKANKEETDHQLREKLNDIEFRKKELLRIRKDVALEIDGLLIYKQRFANTLASVKRNALEICKKCFVARLVSPFKCSAFISLYFFPANLVFKVFVYPMRQTQMSRHLLILTVRIILF